MERTSLNHQLTSQKTEEKKGATMTFKTILLNAGPQSVDVLADFRFIGSRLLAYVPHHRLRNAR